MARTLRVALSICLILVSQGVLQSYDQLFRYIENENISEIRNFIVQHRVNVNNIRNAGHYTPLQFAVMFNKSRVVPVLMEFGADMYIPFGEDGFPPQIAAATGNFNLVRYFIEKWGYDINRREPVRQRTILHFAAEANEEQIVKYLLEQGADPTIVDDRNNLPYHLTINQQLKNSLAQATFLEAAKSDERFNVIKIMVEDFPLDFLLNIRQPETGATALHMAVSNNAYRIAQFLLERGIAPNVKDAYDHSPLWVACRVGNERFVKLLLRHGAKDLYAPFEAARRGYWRIVEFFIKQGFNVNTQDENGRTLLHWAAQKNNVEAVRFLLNNGADISIQDYNDVYPYQLTGNMQIKQQLTPANIINSHIQKTNNQNERNTQERILPRLHEALLRYARNGRGDSIVILQESRPDININYQDSLGNTALHYACIQEKNKYKTVRTLLAFGANVDVQNKEGYTPLCYAIKSGYFNVIKLLIQYGAEWRNPLAIGFPIRFAIENGNLPLVRYFVDTLKFPVDVQDKNGKTLLHYAVQGHQLQMVQYFVEQKHLDPFIVDHQGISAVELSRRLEDSAILKYFENRFLVNNPLENGIRAIINNDSLFFRSLLTRMEHINQQDSLGNTLLHYIIYYQRPHLLQLFLQHAGVNIAVRNNDGQTPITMVIQRGHLQLLRIFPVDSVIAQIILQPELLDAIIKLPDSTAIIMLKYLLTRPSPLPITISNKKGQNILHLAINAQKATIVDSLFSWRLPGGASLINQTDSLNHETPLMYAVKTGQKSIAKLLVTHGADLKIKNRYGLNVIQMAKNINAQWFLEMTGYSQTMWFTNFDWKTQYMLFRQWITRTNHLSTIAISIGLLLLFIIGLAVRNARKPIKKVEALANYTLISQNGSGKVEKFENSQSLQTLISVQEAKRVLEASGVPYGVVEFEEEFLVVKKDKIKYNITLKIMVTPKKILIEL